MKAPVSELIWYLAVSRRMFVAMESAAASRDREMMWLCQWAADTLHNVPGMLRSYDERVWHSPSSLAATVLGFSELIQDLGGPASLSKAADELIRRENATAELRLAADLHDLDSAPDEELGRYLEQLYQLCLVTRQRLPRQALDEEGWTVCEFQGRNNGLLAAVGKDLPLGLVHWREFDGVQFEAKLETAYGRLQSWPR